MKKNAKIKIGDLVKIDRRKYPFLKKGLVFKVVEISKDGLVLDRIVGAFKRDEVSHA
jgi:hypothetical protein